MVTRAGVVDLTGQPTPQFGRPQPAFKYRVWYPDNGIEEQTWPGYGPTVHEEWQTLPKFLVDYLKSPLDPGIGDPSPLYNGVVGSVYPVTVNLLSLVAAVENIRRAYLIIQNLGPGNLWVQFGSSAAVNFCLKFVPSQVYEPQIAGFKGTNCPIRNSVNLVADLAGTTAIIGEATWVPKGAFR